MVSAIALYEKSSNTMALEKYVELKNAAARQIEAASAAFAALQLANDNEEKMQ